MSWFGRQNEIDEAIAKGDLELAMERLARWRSKPERIGVGSVEQQLRSAKRLTTALMDRAEAAISTGHLPAAWKDMGCASEVAAPSDQDQISRQTNQLVELTIEQAETSLLDGLTSRALQLLRLLSERQIMDWRADRIRQVADHLRRSENKASEGKLDEAISHLERAYRLKPEMQQLPGRIESKRQRSVQLRELEKQLQRLALKCQWTEVNQCCEQILALAPRHEIALAAKKHSLQRMKRQTSAGSRLTNVPEDSQRLSASNSFFHIQPGGSNLSAPAASHLDGSVEQETAISSAESFLMWVDGVGGYLVCFSPTVLIGQALEGTTVAIPLQADLRKRHARLELIAGQHLLQPLGSITVDGKDQISATVLRHDQEFGLGDRVRMRYRQPHPLSKTARLDFVSRHRTQPWSDAVILASQSIVLGPNRSNHVFCPHWSSNLILFQRKGQWFCRASRSFQIDGQRINKEGEIGFHSHIAGDDFSLTLEPILKPAGDVHET